MEITPFAIEDGPQVAALFREIFEENGWSERPSDYMDEPQRLFHLPSGGIFLIVKEQRKIIGTAGIIVLSKAEVLVKRFYLKKQYRGLGVAQRLLAELEKQAKQRGLRKVILDVSKNNNRAIHFYEKSGFIKTTVTPRGEWIESQQLEYHYYFYKSV